MASLSTQQRRLLRATRDEQSPLLLPTTLTTSETDLQKDIQLLLQDYLTQQRVTDESQSVHERSHEQDQLVQMILYKHFTAPPLLQEQTCFDCAAALTLTNYLDRHCHHCGHCYCSAHLHPERRRLLRFGVLELRQVCLRCHAVITAEMRADEMRWKQLRVRDYLQRELLPYTNETAGDGQSESAQTFFDLSLLVAKNALFENFPMRVISETAKILSK